MTLAVFYKLLAIVATIAVGWWVQQAQASVAIVVSTLGFMASAGLWLVVLGWAG